MNKLTEGRGSTSLWINNLVLVVNDSEFGHAKNVESFFVDVQYYYEQGVATTEFDPGVPEYVDIIEARISSSVWFNNPYGVKVQIARDTNLINLLTDAQYTELVSQLIRQSKGSVAESIAESQLDKYYDADEGKIINQRARQELGWGLSPKDWEDRE